MTLASAVCRTVFPICQRLDVHITPVTYYSPIPDTRSLADDIWDHPYDLSGIDMDDCAQLALLARFANALKNEYSEIPKEKGTVSYAYYYQNGTFESVDAEVLYCFIRSLRPKLIYEVGSGFSTRLAALAVAQNADQSESLCELVAFDPYADETVRRGFPGLARVVPRRIQDVELELFEGLGADDILFVDSSHVVSIGSDVCHVLLRILPRLNSGVVVHFHDVFLPFEYPRRHVIKNCHFWNEQYALHAFLLFNSDYEVLWAGNYMAHKYPERLEFAFPSYVRERTRPGSLWIRRCR